jgi:hypothetical protein
MADVNLEDLGGTMANYADGFYDDCSTWADVQSGWQAIFAEPNYTLTFSNLVVSTETINNGTGTGLLTGTVDIEENDNGVINNETWSFQMPFDRVGPDWLLYGDQQCSGAVPQSRKQRAMKMLGVTGASR